LKFAELLSSRNGIVGVGVLVFAVLAIVYLLSMTKGGEHPLTLQNDLDLCGLLGDDIWLELNYPASDPVSRVPANADPGMLICALELDPVPPGDRFARVARGDDADQVRTIATVTFNTTATLRASNPAARSDSYAEMFDAEVVASGWEGWQIEGPWSWGWLYSKGEEQTATLVEDDGVVLWTTANGVAPDDLVTFTRAVTRRMRTAN